MIVLFWNIRGLGDDPARRMLSELGRAYSPDLIAIAEPKVRLSDISPRFWRSINMSFLVENARGGGLRPNIWVLYRRNLANIPTVVLCTGQAIILKVMTGRGEMYYGFVHASCSYIIRRQLWVVLMGFSGFHTCVMGDFNAITGDHEHLGRRGIHKASCAEFREFISNAGLVDFEASGPFFTLCSSHSGPILTSRLDHFLVSESFMDDWVSLEALVLPRILSDHHPILLRCKENNERVFKPFCFQNFWVNHANFKELVEESWT